MISTMDHLPFPGISDDQRQVLVQWLYAAADREFHRQRQAARAQDRARHGIRAGALREFIDELTKGS
jgi:hypothetical protein